MRATACAVIVIVITFSGLSAQVDPDQIRRRDAAIQAFLNSPSLTAFSAAGEAIMDAFDQRVFEAPNPRLPPKNRAFEAMKATLAAGIVVAPAALSAASASATENERVATVRLPAVRPSFFKRAEPLFVIALRPFKLVDEDVISLVDALSAVNRLTMRVHVAEPMSFGGNGPYGSYDVGAVEARFEREAPVHAVSRSGQITGYNVRSIKAPVGYQPCIGAGGSVIGTRVNPDWAYAVVAWIGKPSPGNATVTTRQSGGSDPHDKLVSETIDLDRDGVLDFFTVAGIDRSEIVDDVDLPWKAVFVNVEGKWTLASYRAAPDCT